MGGLSERDGREIREIVERERSSERESRVREFVRNVVVILVISLDF